VIMAVISRPKGAEVVVMKERYRATGAGGYSATPCGVEWSKHPGRPTERGCLVEVNGRRRGCGVRYRCKSPQFWFRGAL
jgi:hypothetical protein